MVPDTEIDHLLHVKIIKIIIISDFNNFDDFNSLGVNSSHPLVSGEE